jgi:hypothetical protein
MRNAMQFTKDKEERDLSMSIKTKAASSSPETSEIRSLIMEEFAQWHAIDGALETAIPGVILYRCSTPTEPV